MAALVLCYVACAGARAAELEPPTADEIAKMERAAPERPTAAPKRRRRVLVFSHTPGFKHTVIPSTTKAIEILGRKTGAFETVASDDISMFEPESLATFDAVVLNNTCGIRDLQRAIFLPENFKKLSADDQAKCKMRDEELKKSFAAFVRGGGGLVGIHGATGAFFGWPEYGEMLGGYFKKHPWKQVVQVVLDEPDHPLVAAFEGKPFKIKEETYEVMEPYSRSLVRVLLTLDLSSVNAKKGSRKDGDYALAWIKRHGEGRVFYSAFSHYNETFHDPKMMRFFLDGIQYVLGDLDADATPSARVSKRQPRG